MNQASTTLTALRKMKRDDQYAKLYGLVQHNIETLMRQLKWISEQPREMRLFRITSDFLPAYTVEDFAWVYRDLDTRKLIEGGLAPVRAFADTNGIRLCTHPGQFTTLCTQKPEVLANSIVDLNYHAYVAESMGYGESWHSGGFAINIHANNNLDPGLVQLKDTIKNKLSLTLRNLLTIENDEFGCSLDEMIAAQLYHVVPIVLDIHHHWVESGGEYIQPNDPRIDWIKLSWMGVRPLGHFSTSSEELLKGACSVGQPDFKLLSEAGHKPSKLRAHSYGCWNQGSNDWALSHLVWTDLEVEAKGKQIASRQLYERARSLGTFVEAPTLAA
jgi:UV DNA damage repair endonuclease